MTIEERRIFLKAIIHYGIENQKNQAVEEMSELIKEICKANRGMINTDNVAEEIADVEIMIDQLKIMYSLGDSVDKFRKYKIKRLEYKIENNEK